MSAMANTEKAITIVVKEFYPGDNSLQKTAKVNQKTYEDLCINKVHSASEARKDRR